MEETIDFSELDQNAQSIAQALKDEGKEVYAHKRRFWAVKAEEDVPEKTGHLYKRVLFDA